MNHRYIDHFCYNQTNRFNTLLNRVIVATQFRIGMRSIAVSMHLLSRVYAQRAVCLLNNRPSKMNTKLRSTL